MNQENLANKEKVFGAIAFRWLGNAHSGRNIFRVLVFLCFCLLGADFVYHRHGHFEFEEIPMFFSIYGFIMFSLIIFGAKALRVLIKRNENYYGQRAIDSEPQKKMSEND